MRHINRPRAGVHRDARCGRACRLLSGPIELGGEDALATRDWCNGSTVAFQASSRGSSPLSRSASHPVSNLDGMFIVRGMTHSSVIPPRSSTPLRREQAVRHVGEPWTPEVGQRATIRIEPACGYCTPSHAGLTGVVVRTE